MSRFEVTPTPLAGLQVIQRERRGDARGFLSRLFCSRELASVGWDRLVVQINHTHTRERASVRGLHFQHPPHAETKLVSCLRGEVWDVAVDLRAGSPTFLRWHAECLSADNGRALLIPRGFAHGFQTLKPDCELLYLHDAAYEPDVEGGVHPHDPRVFIQWPLVIGEMSQRDLTRPMLAETFQGIPV